MKATKKIVFFGAMSSILLIGAANAETHVATKGYADTHVAGDPAATTGNADGQVLTWDATEQKWTNKDAASFAMYAEHRCLPVQLTSIRMPV